MRRRGNLVVLRQRSTAFHAASTCAARSFSVARTTRFPQLVARDLTSFVHIVLGGAGAFQCSCLVMKRRGNVVVLTQRYCFSRCLNIRCSWFLLMGHRASALPCLRSCCSTICCQLRYSWSSRKMFHLPPRPQDSKHKNKQKETDLIDPPVSGHRPPHLLEASTPRATLGTLRSSCLFARTKNGGSSCSAANFPSALCLLNTEAAWHLLSTRHTGSTANALHARPSHWKPLSKRTLCCKVGETLHVSVHVQHALNRCILRTFRLPRNTKLPRKRKPSPRSQNASFTVKFQRFAPCCTVCCTDVALTLH